MKMKKAILSCLMLMGVLSVSAQEQKGTTEYVFEPHWYLQLQGGAQYTTGEANFGDMISPTIQGAVGYQFSQSVGARLGINAWQSKTGWKQEHIDKVHEDGYSIDNFKYTYFAPAIDLTFNLSNIIAGFNPARKLNFGAFIGVGLNVRMQSDDAKNQWSEQTAYQHNHDYGWDWAPLYNHTASEDESKVFLLGRAGLTADYQLTDAWSIGLELNGNILSDKYNFKNAGNPDSYFNLLAGVKYNFGPTYSTRFIPAPEPEIRYVDKIVEKIVEVPAPAPAAVEPLRRDIFFEINKTIIRDSEKQKVQDIADYMNAHPTSKVMITGYADAGTGNNRINDRLAKGRAQVVVKALKEQYGIAESRISWDSKGSRVQPFAENDLNRVSICIAE
ncbi:MAG: OmpA family protein [Prevotella sp.]|nr:OmpA family protein [Prevotella sp.]